MLVNRVGWFYGVLFGIGFLTSIVLHELGHSIVAIRKGCKVRKITLMCIGGAAQMERVPERPRDETLMALAGPAVSLVLAGLLIGVAWFVPPPPLPGAERVFTLLWVLGHANLFLGLFNLLPAFPMDGGRVLRAALTPKFGRLRATGAASRIGQVIAIGGGLYGLIQGEWMLLAVSVFIFLAAGSEYRMERVQEHIRRMRGGWPYPFGEEPPPEQESGGRVLISPPPYARGPLEVSNVLPDEPDNRPPRW